MIEMLFWFMAYIASVIGTMAAFGISTILLPAAMLIFDFKTALVLVSLFHISGNIGRITFFKRGFDKNLMLEFGVPSVVLTLIGALLVNYVSQPILKLFLGLFLVGFSVLSIIKPDLSIPANRRNSFVGGSLYGFFSGLVGTGGPLRGAFLTSLNLEKDVYISTSGSISFLVDLTRIPVYLASGFLRPQYYWYVPVLFFIAIAGSYTSRRIVTSVSQQSFRKFILTALFLSGLKLVYDSLT
jgi:hypothetical protein